MYILNRMATSILHISSGFKFFMNVILLFSVISKYFSFASYGSVGYLHVVILSCILFTGCERLLCFLSIYYFKPTFIIMNNKPLWFFLVVFMFELNKSYHQHSSAADVSQSVLIILGFLVSS